VPQIRRSCRAPYQALNGTGDRARLQSRGHAPVPTKSPSRRTRRGRRVGRTRALWIEPNRVDSYVALIGHPSVVVGRSCVRGSTRARVRRRQNTRAPLELVAMNRAVRVTPPVARIGDEASRLADCCHGPVAFGSAIARGIGGSSLDDTCVAGPFVVRATATQQLLQAGGVQYDDVIKTLAPYGSDEPPGARGVARNSSM